MRSLLPISLSLFLFALTPLHAQHVTVHTSYEGIYLFLDELASRQVIDLHSLVKPWSRGYIAQRLLEADARREELNNRQRAELDFYLRDFRRDQPESTRDPAGQAGSAPDQPATSWFWQKNHGDKRFDVFHYSDSLFTMTVNPILGADLRSNSGGPFYHWWNGVEARSTIGRFGIWASVRDNHESTELTAREFQNSRIGASNLKLFSGGKRDYWELRGGITFSWKWGHTGLIMEQFSWGENNAGAGIFSGRTPAFPRFELAMHPAGWFRFTYIHASPVSEVVDSSLSFFTTNAYGTEYREVYHPKHLAANIFTFIPLRGLQLSIGNSVVYDFRGFHMGFLLPVAFYKSIDHTLNAGINNMNSQLFFSASSRNLRHFHFYGSVFLDEVATGRIFDPDQFNFVSCKAGVSSTILPNTRAVLEVTWTNSLAFRHNVPTTTYESNRYNLGHYLEDNAKDLYAALEHRPFRATMIRVYFNRSLKGPDHTLLGSPRTGPAIAPFDPIVWKSVRAGVLATFQVINDLDVRLGFQWREVSGEEEYLEMWTPDVYRGTTGTWQVGLNYGF